MFNRKEELELLRTFVHKHTQNYDESHDVNHAQAVHDNAMDIIKYEKNIVGLQVRLITWAAWLHDVCDHKYIDHSSSSLTLDGLKQFIDTYNAPLFTHSVMKIIDNVSWSKESKGLCKRLTPILQKCLDIVRDADRLEAIGEIGIRRCIQFAQARGAKVPEDVVTHCHEKLLRLYNNNFIVTRRGQELALPRHQIIVTYVRKCESDKFRWTEWFFSPIKFMSQLVPKFI